MWNGIRAAGAVLRLLAALVAVAVGLIWARHRAVARFRRTLRGQGLPAEFVSALTAEFREAFRISRLLGDTSRRARPRRARSQGAGGGTM